MRKGDYAFWLSCFLFFGLIGFALTLPGVTLGQHVHQAQGDITSATLDSYVVITDSDLCVTPPLGPLQKPGSNALSVSSPFFAFSSSFSSSPHSVTLQDNTCTNYLFYYQVRFSWKGQEYNLTACDTHTEIYCQQCATGIKQIGVSNDSGPKRCPRFTRCSKADFGKYQVTTGTQIYISDYHDPPFVYLSDPRSVATKLFIAGTTFLCFSVLCCLPICYSKTKRFRATNRSTTTLINKSSNRSTSTRLEDHLLAVENNKDSISL